MGSAFMSGLGIGAIVMGPIVLLFAFLKPGSIKYPDRAKIVGVIAAILGIIILASLYKP